MSQTTETQKNEETKLGLNFENTPVLPDGYEGYMDADEELSKIAKHIKTSTVHNDSIETNRIKFLYSTMNPKKEGGRYVLSALTKRSDIDKMVNDDYDYIITVFYDVWKDLDVDNKIIQLDKVLCGIDMGTIDKPALKKKPSDTREYNDNLRYYGPEKVLNSSEMVDLACQRIFEEKKEKKREEREMKKMKI
tara:strand:- start:941 stop:1516 length:576 start_codon:yes stop_codon:yes gene_type:complete